MSNRRPPHNGFARASGGGGGGALPKKAKNEFNQPALDHLREMSQRPRFATSQHYPRVFRRGMTSLSKCPTEVRTVADARALNGVGEFLAGVIAGKVSSLGLAGGDGGESSSTAASASAASAPASSRPRGGRGGKGGGTAAGRKRPPPPTRGPSAKQTAYARTVREAEGLSATLHSYSDWRVVLLLDVRERKADHVQSKLLMSGVECEQRQLPIGDMLWIARGVRRPRPGSPASNNGANTVEVVLGTVVERKTPQDLASSLFGTRFEEQRLRLKNSAAGASQVLFLVEGSTVNDLPNCPGGTLRYAMMQTQVHLGFAVVRTKSLDDTVRYLKRIHRRLMKRSFPSEFRSADAGRGRGGGRSVPLFASPDARGGGSSAAVASNGGNDGEEGEGRLTFRTPPVPYDGAPRHALYDEFRAKIELARESGTRSVSSVYRAMLKQVDTMSVTKVHAVTDAYRTPRALIEAYRGATADRAERLVQDVRIGTSRVRKCRVGPKSSKELAMVWTVGGTKGRRTGRSSVREEDGGDATVARSSAAFAVASSGGITNADTSDDDDDYGRTPKRRNVGRAAPSRREGRVHVGGDSDPKPSADHVADGRSTGGDSMRDDDGTRELEIPRSYDLTQDSASSSSSAGGEQFRPGARATSSLSSSHNGSKHGGGQAPSDRPPVFAAGGRGSSGTPESNKENDECFDLTMDSSDDDDQDDVDGGRKKPARVSEESGGTTSSDHVGGTILDRRPRLSHDGSGDEDVKGANSSDSDSSCELMVRLQKRALDDPSKKPRPESAARIGASVASASAEGSRRDARRDGELDSSPQAKHAALSPSKQEEPTRKTHSPVEVIELD